MKLEDRLYAYVGAKTGKVYTYLSPTEPLARAAILSYLRYEPTATGNFVHRTLIETEALLPKFRLQAFKVVPTDG